MEVYFEPCKYHGKWAVFDTKTWVYYYIGKGKRYCFARAKELNDYCAKHKQKGE